MKKETISVKVKSEEMMFSSTFSQRDVCLLFLPVEQQRASLPPPADHAERERGGAGTRRCRRLHLGRLRHAQTET